MNDIILFLIFSALVILNAFNGYWCGYYDGKNAAKYDAPSKPKAPTE